MFGWLNNWKMFIFLLMTDIDKKELYTCQKLIN